MIYELLASGVRRLVTEESKDARTRTRTSKFAQHGRQHQYEVFITHCHVSVKYFLAIRTCCSEVTAAGETSGGRQHTASLSHLLETLYCNRLQR